MRVSLPSVQLIIIDARSVPSGTEIFVDVCIIGGGAPA
jgi:hypothetical protein